jgi:hypothetical protein
MKPVVQEYFARLTKPIQLPPLKAPNVARKSRALSLGSRTGIHRGLGLGLYRVPTLISGHPPGL